MYENSSEQKKDAEQYYAEFEVDSSNLNNLDIITRNVIKQVSPIDNIVGKFPEVFEQKIGCTPKYKISLKLRENVSPSYAKERTIPY